MLLRSMKFFEVTGAVVLWKSSSLVNFGVEPMKIHVQRTERLLQSLDSPTEFQVSAFPNTIS